MTADSVLIALGWASLLLWGAIAGFCSPAIYRGYRYSERPGDPLRAFLFFVAMLLMSFNARRLIAPDDAGSLVGLYVLSCMCAFVGILILRRYRVRD